MSAMLVGGDGPASSDGGKRRHAGKSCRHPRQRRQGAFQEMLRGPGEDKGQDGRNARVGDYQYAAQISEKKWEHGTALSDMGSGGADLAGDLVQATAQAGGLPITDQRRVLRQSIRVT